jgi:hypothetical protein
MSGSRPIGQTNQGEAWLQLMWIRRKLTELEKLAYPDRIQGFVWELNDFLSSARKVLNYLRREPRRPKGFREWVEAEFKKLEHTDARFRFFLNARNISDKDMPVVPQMSEIRDEVVSRLELSGDRETEFKHPETGETVAVFRPVDSGVAPNTIKIYKRIPYYILDGWESEDVLTFLRNIVSTLEDFVRRAYEAYPDEATDFLTRAVGIRFRK